MRLVSGDGFVFVCDTNVACVSKLIARTLENETMIEAQRGEILFPEILGAVLEICVQYFHAQSRSQSLRGASDFPLEDDSLLLELLAASNYLDC